MTIQLCDLTKQERKRFRDTPFRAIVDGCILFRRDDGTTARIAA